MPILLAVNRNIAVLRHLKWRELSSKLFQKGSVKVLNEGEVKIRSKIRIGMNLRYEGYWIPVNAGTVVAFQDIWIEKEEKLP